MNKKTNKPPFTIQDVLRDLYKRIPKFECEPGCTKCCGYVPWSGAEWDALEEKRESEELNCPYIVEGEGCSVYEKRPFMCRLFGASVDDGMVCPVGCGPKHPLSVEKSHDLLKIYKKVMAVTGLKMGGVDYSNPVNAVSSVLKLIGREINKTDLLKKVKKL